MAQNDKATEAGTVPARSLSLIRADLVTGLVLVALGAAALIESLRMPRFEELNINPYTVPGLVPGALGVIILVLGAVLAGRSAHAASRISPDTGSSIRREPGTTRLGLAVFLCVGYAGLLVGRLPFWLATFLFISLFVVLFEWPTRRTRHERLRGLALASVLGAAVSAVVTLVFQEVFLVRLP